MHSFVVHALTFLLVGAGTAMSQQSGSITVTSDGAPAAGIDIFVFVNQGKQPVGTTNRQGSLPFDPALLAGKLQGEGVERTCSARTEIILVAEGENYRCEERDANGDRCDCEPAGAWLISNGRISVQLTQGTSTAITRNPIFLGAAGAGAVTAIVVAGGGSDSSTGTPRTSRDPASPGVTSSPSATSLNGNYPGNFVLLRDECHFFAPSFNGTAVVEATPSGSLTLKVIESITRTYQGTLTVTGDGNGMGTATGSGSIGSIMITHEAKLTFTNGRLTIEETIRKPQGGNCAATYRAQNLARQ